MRQRLLDTILFEFERMFKSQPYLELLYKTIFLIAFYGLLRIGEVAESPHAIKAANVFIGTNKNKVLLILYSSKTHGKESRPQRVKISESIQSKKGDKFFCPFRTIKSYFKLRGPYRHTDEQFFVFRDGSNVTPDNIRLVLNQALKRLDLDSTVYSFHSIRIGRATQLIKDGCSIEEVKRLGRWKSNAVYRYIKMY